MIKYFCDNCGKEVDKPLAVFIEFMSLVYKDRFGTENHKRAEKYFCEKCHSLFIERLDETL